MAAAAPTYRAVEKDVADAELRLQARYGQGISATYVCSTCSRFAYEHPDCNVKDCRESVLIPEEYETRLVDQLQDLQNVLDEKEKADKLAAAFDEQKEESDARLVKLGAFMQKHKRITKRLQKAIQERTATASTNEEFLEDAKQICKALRDLKISKVLSPSLRDIDEDSNDDPPPRAPVIPTPPAVAPAPRPPHVTPAPPPHVTPAPTPHVTPAPPPPPPPPTTTPKTSPPKLREQPGVTIIHSNDGDVCGGVPDGDKTMKALKSVDCGAFNTTQGGINFLKAKNKLFSFFQTCCAQDTMYTLVAILSRLSPDLKCQIEQLQEKKNHFTSFEAFFREFEKLIYPDLETILLTEINAFKQGKKSVRTYYTQFKYLLNELGVDEDRYVLQFIRNLTDPVIREAMRARPIAIAEDKMKSVADHAIRMEETETEEKRVFHLRNG